MDKKNVHIQNLLGNSRLTNRRAQRPSQPKPSYQQF